MTSHTCSSETACRRDKVTTSNVATTTTNDKSETLLFERTNLPESLQTTSLWNAKVTPLTIQQDSNSDSQSLVQEVKPHWTGQQMIQHHTSTYGSICYVVRRPGCVLCREEGASLHSLVENRPPEENAIHGFGLFGMIKEIHVDDQGLSEFYSQYFPHPLYHDMDHTFYQALGNRQLTFHYNPIRMISWLRSFRSRISKKKIVGNLKGEGFLQGGIIVFDHVGQARFAYQEESGKELPIAQIIAACNLIRNEISTTVMEPTPK